MKLIFLPQHILFSKFCSRTYLANVASISSRVFKVLCRTTALWCFSISSSAASCFNFSSINFVCNAAVSFFLSICHQFASRHAFFSYEQHMSWRQPPRHTRHKLFYAFYFAGAQFAWVSFLLLLCHGTAFNWHCMIFLLLWIKRLAL